MLGADSRVSTGNYVSNRASDKTTPLTENVYLLRSGSAADTQVVADYGECFLYLEYCIDGTSRYGVCAQTLQHFIGEMLRGFAEAVHHIWHCLT